jgi:hypothetical protein
MKWKKIISVMLILVLSIQLLPVKQMMSWLLSGQMTEEIAHANDGSKDTGTDEEVNKHFLANNTLHDIAPPVQTLMSARHQTETLVARHADDIPTPPPNC